MSSSQVIKIKVETHTREFYIKQMNENQEEYKKQYSKEETPRDSLQPKSVSQESQTRLIGTTTQQVADSDDTFRRGSSLGSVMHDHQLLFQKRSVVESSNAPTPGDGTRSERTQQPMLGSLGTGSGPIVGLNANHAKSKVTSLIRRKASDLEEEHDLQYSDSPNATTHYFQLEGTGSQAAIGKKHHKNVASVVPEREEEGGSRVDTSYNNNAQPHGVSPGYINDINQECSQLIQNLNFTKGQNGGGESSFERESQVSSVINQKRSIESMDHAVNQGSSNKKESLNASKSDNLHKDHPKLPPHIQKQTKQGSEKDHSVHTHQLPSQKDVDSLNNKKVSEEDALTQQLQINPSQRIIMNDNSSERIEERTSTTHDLRNAMEMQFNPQLLNVNSDTDTHYNQQVNNTREEEKISDNNNPIFVHHAGSSDDGNNSSQKKGLGFFGGRRSSEHQKILNEISPYLGNETNVPVLSRPMATNQLANTNMTQSNRITFRMQHQDTQKSQEHDDFEHSSIMKMEDDEDLGRAPPEGDTMMVAANFLKEATHSSAFILNGTHRRYEENPNHNGSTEGLINQDSENEETKRQDEIQQPPAQAKVKDQQYHDLRQSVHYLHPAPEVVPTYTDDAIYNRLPKNFFVQEAEEQFDLGEVMASIQRMRQDFVGYMNENKVQDKIEEINEMIYMQPPEKFIERQLKAMGLEGGESVLFEKVLPNGSPAPSNLKSSFGGNNEIAMREPEPINLYQQHESNFGSNDQFDTRTHQSNVTSKVQFCDPVSSIRRSIDDVISQKGNVEVIEEKLNRKEFEQFPNKQKEDQNFYAASTLPESVPPKKQVVQQQAQLPKQLAIKNLKMADYFRDDHSKDNTAMTSAISHQHQQAIADQIITEKEEQSEIIDSNLKDEELPNDIKAQLVDRLEQEILGNIDVNFLFHKGERLRFGLIDQHRLYKIMLKIKEVAQKQIYEKGSKQIDYTEIVQYLEEEDQYLTEGEKSKIHQMQNDHMHKFPTAEPKKTKIPQEEVLDDTKWIQVVDFMRKNPKLMLQMLPGDWQEEEPIQYGNQAQAPGAPAGVTNLAQLQAAKAQEEQKRIQKLKNLSSKYTSNRKDFLEAIDRFQEKEFLLNSPKGNQNQAFGPVQPGQKQKTVQVKSITMNQRKVRRAHQVQRDRTNEEGQVGSDGDFVRNGSNEPKKQMIFEKHFSYTSANQAKNIYNAAPYPLPQVSFNDLGSGSENEQHRANEGSQPRPQNYQQHSMLDQLATKTSNSQQQNIRKRQSVQPRKSVNPARNDLNTLSGEVIHYPIQRLAGGHGGVASNMSNLESTTMTGGTNHFTNHAKNYRNNITNQIKTISQEDTQDDHGIVSTTSMFTKFVKQPMDAQPASRRPITANAAMGGGMKHHHNMRVISDSQIYSQPSTTNIGFKSTNQMFRLPSASGMSSLSNQQTVKQEGNSTVEIPGNPKYNQQFPKFVTDKRMNWLNSGQHLKDLAKQSEDLNTSIKSNTIMNSTAIITSQNQHEPPVVSDSKLSGMGRRTKTQRVVHRRQQIVPSIVADAENYDNESDIINPNLLNRETSPERKTKDFIDKIAPNIKHNELYPKFVNRIARRQTPVSMSNSNSQIDDQSDRNNSSVLVPGQNYEKDYQTAIQNIKQRKKSEVNISRRPPQAAGVQKFRKQQQANNYSMVNQSTVSFKEAGQQEEVQSLASNRQNKTQDNNQHVSSQGEYPKFVKNPSKYSQGMISGGQQKSLQRVGSTHSSQRRSVGNFNGSDDNQNDNVGAEVRPVSSGGYNSANDRVMVSQTQQTRLGGLGNKLLISPKQGGIYGGEPENCAFDDYQYESGNDSDDTVFQKRRLLAQSKCLFPVVDWAFTPLFTRAINDDIGFNMNKDMSMYEEKEVDYVIDMMKNKYKEFKRSDIMRPFYLKAQLTLKALLQEQAQEVHCERLMYKYKEVTIENTMKLLIRCKLNFHCRLSLFEILKLIINYELHAVQFKDLVGTYAKHKVDQVDVDKINEYAKRVTDAGYEFLVKVKALRQVHKHFRKIPFIFKQKDFVNYVKNEMLEVRKLSSVFKVRSLQDIEEEEKSQREAEEKRLTTLLEKQRIIQLQQELEQMGVDHTIKENEGVREETEEWEEVEVVDPASLLSPLRVVP